MNDGKNAGTLIHTSVTSGSIFDEFLSQHFCYFITLKNSLFNSGKKL